MTNEQKSIKDRRGKTSELIDHMLIERNQLLALLLQVSGIDPEETSEPDKELLNEFCQLLVDYIAAGHFGLYERIVKKTERRKSVADLAIKVYPKIDETTQYVLSFNEKYDLNNQTLDLSCIQEDLSKLGEELTSRIELEDQLINQLFESADTVSV